jgi:hypothetical protein
MPTLEISSKKLQVVQTAIQLFTTYGFHNAYRYKFLLFLNEIKSLCRFWEKKRHSKAVRRCLAQAPSYGFAVPFFLPETAQAFYLI